MKDSAPQGQTDPRIEELRRKLTNSPNDANVYNSIGDLYLTEKRRDQAADAYMHAAAFYTRDGGSLKAIAVYKKILKLDPNRPDIYTLIGDLNSERGLANNAIGDYLTGAKLYLKEGNTKQALSLYRKITNANPINTSVRLRVAELCLKEGETKEAIEEYLLIADAYERQGKSASAREIYEKVIEVVPSHSEARRQLGLAPLVVEQGPIEPPISLDSPADAPQLEGISGTIEFNLEGLDLEPPVAAEAPAVPGATPSASLDEARRWLASGDINRAEQAVRTLLLEDPDRSEYQAILGLVYLHKGDSSTAFEILYPIAQALAEEGRHDAALEAANAFLAIEPDQSDFLELRARVGGPSSQSLGLPGEPVVLEIPPAGAELGMAPVEAAAPIELQVEEAVSPPEPVVLEVPPLVGEEPVAEPVEAAVPLELQPEEAVGALATPADEALVSLADPILEPSAETLVDTTSFAAEMEEEEKEAYESSAIEVTVSDEQAIEMGSSQNIDGEFEAILQEFREGITKQLGDEDYETHYDLGIAYKEMGLFDEAIEEFQKAARGTIRFVDSCMMIAACYKARNLNKSAIACLEHALEDPRCMEATAPYVHYDLAVLYEEENMPDKAMRLYALIPTIRDASERLTKLQSGASLSK